MKGLVPNPQGFFSGLPIQAKKKGHGISFGINKADRELQKLETFRAQQARIQDKIAR